MAPERDRFIHAVIDWLLTDSGLHNRLVQQPFFAKREQLLEEWLSLPTGDPRWREAPSPAVAVGQKFTLSEDNPSPLALGGGLGIAAMLLSRELPDEAALPIANPDDMQAAWTRRAIHLIHNAFEEATARGGHLATKAQAAGFPEKLVNLDRGTLRNIYNRIQAARLDAGLARRPGDGHFDGDLLGLADEGED